MKKIWMIQNSTYVTKNEEMYCWNYSSDLQEAIDSMIEEIIARVYYNINPWDC